MPDIICCVFRFAQPHDCVLVANNLNVYLESADNRLPNQLLTIVITIIKRESDESSIRVALGFRFSIACQFHRAMTNNKPTVRQPCSSNHTGPQLFRR